VEPSDVIDRTYRQLGAGIFEAERLAEALLEREPDERAFLALILCDGEIGNGGFEQLFGNSTGPAVGVAIEGALRFGLEAHAQILELALAAPWERDRSVAAARLHELEERWFSLEADLQRNLLEVAVARNGS
jgi:hypothetical protein